MSWSPKRGRNQSPPAMAPTCAKIERTDAARTGPQTPAVVKISPTSQTSAVDPESYSGNPALVPWPSMPALPCPCVSCATVPNSTSPGLAYGRRDGRSSGMLGAAWASAGRWVVLRFMVKAFRGGWQDRSRKRRQGFKTNGTVPNQTFFPAFVEPFHCPPGLAPGQSEFSDSGGLCGAGTPWIGVGL